MLNQNKLVDLWQRSSEVEQGTHKPLVSGPIPLAAIFFYIFNYAKIVFGKIFKDY